LAGRAKKGWEAQRTMFGSLLDEMIGSGAQHVFDTVKQVAPKCAFCYSPTIFRCMSCGKFVCRTHAFANVQSVEHFNVICAECIGQHFPFVTVAPPPGASSYGPEGSSPPRDDESWPYREKPWEILGINWYAKEDEIKDAFKREAKRVHPDHASDEKDRQARERAMKMVAAAKEWMLRHRKG